MLLAEISGWVGAFTTLTAYTAFSMGWITSGRLFQTMNLIGSAALIINAFHQQAWPFVLLNTVWGSIAVVALIRIPRRRHHTSGIPSDPTLALVDSPES